MAESKSLLIVDDSKVSRMMIKAIIVEHFPQFEVIEAGDGDEALACFEGRQINVAITDFNMPGMDGLELAKAMREKSPSTKICLLTANIQESNQRHAEDVGIGFAKKPITEDKIITIIKEMV